MFLWGSRWWFFINVIVVEWRQKSFICFRTNGINNWHPQVVVTMISSIPSSNEWWSIVSWPTSTCTCSNGRGAITFNKMISHNTNVEDEEPRNREGRKYSKLEAQPVDSITHVQYYYSHDNRCHLHMLRSSQYWHSILPPHLLGPRTRTPLRTSTPLRTPR